LAEVNDAPTPLDSEIKQLQKTFAQIDMNLAIQTLRKKSRLLFLLVCKLENIRIRMDGNRNHKRPHVHIDYKEEYHSASYAIDNGERLAGNLGTQYDHSVRRWIAGSRPKLTELWLTIQAGRKPDNILLELRGKD
jgi:hypothetical protein